MTACRLAILVAMTVAILAAMTALGTPASAAPPLEAYGQLPAVEIMRLSPSGERFATIATINDKRRLIVGTRDKVLQAKEIGDRKILGLSWADEDHVLVHAHSTFKAPFLLTAGQVELRGIVNLDVTTGKVASVFDKLKCSGEAVFGEFGSATVDHHAYGYYGAARFIQTRSGDCMVDTSQGALVYDLYQVDLDSGHVELIARGSRRLGGWAIGTDGKVAANAEIDRKNGIWRLYAGQDQDKLLMEAAAPVLTPDLYGLGRTPGTVLVVNPTEDQDPITEINVDTGAKAVLAHGGSSVHALRDRASGLLLGFTTDDPDYPQVFNEALRARLKAVHKAFPAYRVSVVSYSQDFDRLIVFTDTGDDSGTYWLVNIHTGKADPVGYPYPKIRPEDVGPTRMYSYKAADGLALDGLLTLPPGSKGKKLPVVILPHGGPMGSADGLGFDWWSQAYASAGYAVFQPNYRGSSGRGTAFRKAGSGEWGNKMLGDIVDGLAALAADGIVDPHRACIVGSGYGGYAALASVTLRQDGYRCAVSVAGPSDMPAYLTWYRRGHGNYSEWLRFLREATGVGEDGNIGDTKRISPSEMAARASAPILLIHGVDDTVVPISQSVAMDNALKRADKRVKFIRMKGEDHWLSRSKTRTQMLQASVDFVKQYDPVD